MGRIRMKQVEGLGNVTVAAAIEEFLKNCRLRNLSPKTIRYYEEDLRYSQYLKADPCLNYLQRDIIILSVHGNNRQFTVS